MLFSQHGCRAHRAQSWDRPEEGAGAPVGEAAQSGADNLPARLRWMPLQSRQMNTPNCLDVHLGFGVVQSKHSLLSFFARSLLNSKSRSAWVPIVNESAVCEGAGEQGSGGARSRGSLLSVHGQPTVPRADRVWGRGLAGARSNSEESGSRREQFCPVCLKV